MDENAKILEDISTLTQMCHAKNDGPTLKIEESEIKNKIAEYDQEIEDIKTTEAEESYDTSAEMADRNIEIITKKVIQSLTNKLKSLTTDLEKVKEEEQELSNTLYGLKRTKTSYEKYITSLKDRLTTTEDVEAQERYSNIINTTKDKIVKQDEAINEIEEKHTEVQTKMDELSSEISKIEEKLEYKRVLLKDAQTNLENKELYIDKAKKEKNEKRIEELENKKKELDERLTSITKDPKYLELKIKEIIGNTDNYDARNYIIELLTAASKVPYMDEYSDNALEEKLLSATKERDDFAAEIDSKTYDLMDLETPEQIRVEFLNQRIAYWQEEVKRLTDKVSSIDKDENFKYEEKSIRIEELLKKLREETSEFKNEYDKESPNNLSNKAILKITYEEKKADLEAAEEIASRFRKNEAEDAEEAGRIIKTDIEKYNNKIKEAEEEIAQIKDRLNNRKSGTKDISAKNRDRDQLANLAQVVIDIKHRRQFADRVFDIAERLEYNLGMKLVDAVYSKEEKERIKNETRVVATPVEEQQPVAEPAPVAEATEVEPAIAEEVVVEEPVVIESTSAENISVEDNQQTVDEQPTEQVTTEEVQPEVNKEEVPVAEPVQEEPPVEQQVEEEPIEETTEQTVEPVIEPVVEEPPAEEPSIESVQEQPNEEKEEPVIENPFEKETVANPEPVQEEVSTTSTEEYSVEQPESSMEISLDNPVISPVISNDKAQEETVIDFNIPSISSTPPVEEPAVEISPITDNNIMANIPVAEVANDSINIAEPKIDDDKEVETSLPIAEPAAINNEDFEITPSQGETTNNDLESEIDNNSISIPTNIPEDDPIIQIPGIIDGNV